MRQAFLITAYKDFDWIEKTVDIYTSDGIDCYIHMDKKTRMPKEFTDYALDSPYKDTVKNTSLFYNQWSPGGVARFLPAERSGMQSEKNILG